MIKLNYLIESLKKNDEKAIRDFYDENKNGFFLFARRYNLQADDICDMYQDAIVALLENAKKGKIDDLKSSLSTYLIGIGKFMIFQKFKKESRKCALTEFEKVEILYEEYNEERINLQIIELQKGFEKLGEQCRKLLLLFYYEEKKLDQIVTDLGYTNKDVLKSQKSRCLKQLKVLTKN